VKRQDGLKVGKDVGMVLELYIPQSGPKDASLDVETGRTVTDRLDRGDLHDLLDVLGSEVAEAQRTALKSAVMDQCLEVSPELPDLPVFRDEGVVNQQQIRNGTEAGDRFLDAALDILCSGLGVLSRLASTHTRYDATKISLLELDTEIH
jgi:hypothetical protein